MSAEKRCYYDGFDKASCFYHVTMAANPANNGKCLYEKVCKYQTIKTCCIPAERS